MLAGKMPTRIALGAADACPPKPSGKKAHAATTVGSGLGAQSLPQDEPIYGGAEDGYEQLAPVGSFPSGASPYGALDMAGNVWEWCADWYDANYYATGPTKDPQGPETGRFKILRGGSWINPGPVLRSINRFEVLPVERSPYIGFRCARSP